MEIFVTDIFLIEGFLIKIFVMEIFVMEIFLIKIFLIKIFLMEIFLLKIFLIKIFLIVTWLDGDFIDCPDYCNLDFSTFLDISQNILILDICGLMWHMVFLVNRQLRQNAKNSFCHFANFFAKLMLQYWMPKNFSSIKRLFWYFRCLFIYNWSKI